MSKITDFFDSVADKVMPKELAPFAGPLSMMFAGPLGMPLALGLGQLGSAKLHSGKLDPYTAMGTFLSAQGYKARNPQGYGKISDSLKGGIAGIFDDGNLQGFKTGYNAGNPGTYYKDLMAQQNALAKKGVIDAYQMERTALSDMPDRGEGLYKYDIDEQMKLPISERAAYAEARGAQPYETGVRTSKIDPLDAFKDPGSLSDAEKALIKSSESTFGPGGTLDRFTQGVGEGLFPGFTSEDPKTGKMKFDLTKTLTTIGTTTTLSQVIPLAEELKKQQMKDEEEEGAAWREWFSSYKRSSGRSYGDSPYPDPEVTRLWNKYGKPFGLAMGGRVGYNKGGDTGIIAAAPGMPEGMQLDGRDGLFISQGVEEKADDVPAMLSKNEFVLTADAMKGFDKMSGGSGDPRAAAQKMYQFMDQMEAIA